MELSSTPTQKASQGLVTTLPEVSSLEGKVAQIFNSVPNSESSTPYHMDGDTEMYTAENMEKREVLFLDKDIQKGLQDIVKLYKFEKGQLGFKEYSRIHEKIAVIMRPEVAREQLQFLVKEDFELDSAEGPITAGKLSRLLFDMVDVWTASAQKQEYLSFIRGLLQKLRKLL